MKKVLRTQSGSIISIEISEEGKATYTSGNRTTTFSLRDCQAISYEFEDNKIVITPEMLDATEDVEPWLWLVISEGENRIEYNNNQTESRRHQSYSIENDKYDTLASEENHLERLIKDEEIEDVKNAIKMLEPEHQDLILDIFYRGLTMAEVSRREGLNKSTVTRRLTKILDQLKKVLKNCE